MKAARIVYSLIAILILIPIFASQIKKIREFIRLKRKADANRQFIYLTISAIVIILMIISLFRFTIGYEAPLVAERVSQVFIEAGINNKDQAEFEKLLNDKKLASENISITGYDEIINELDFTKDYDMHLSERIYKNGDNENMYCKYIQDEDAIYIEIGLENSDNKWKVLSFTILDEESVEEIDSKMKFLVIK